MAKYFLLNPAGSREDAPVLKPSPRAGPIPIVTPGPDTRSVRTATGEILNPPADWSLLPPGDPPPTRRQYCVLGSGHALLSYTLHGSSLISSGMPLSPVAVTLGCLPPQLIRAALSSKVLATVGEVGGFDRCGLAAFARPPLPAPCPA